MNNDKYNKEDYDEQIQFNDNISFPEKQQMNKNILNQEQMSEKNQLKENQNINQNEIKDINREKYLQFLKEQALESKNNIRNYPPEQNQFYQERERENEQNYIHNQNSQYQNEYNQRNKNQISQREYQEYQEQIKPPTPQPFPQQPNKYLSYQEQISRIQKQKEQEQENIERNNNNNYPSNIQQNQQISEYNKNKIRNLYTNNNIFKQEKTPQIEPKYNDEPLTEKEKKELIQKDYAKFLDWQINEKSRGKTPYNQKKYNPILDDIDNNVNSHINNPQEQNNYDEMKYKENLMNKLPIVPYRNKNYEMNNRNEYGYINNYNLMKK